MPEALSDRSTMEGKLSGSEWATLQTRREYPSLVRARKSRKAEQLRGVVVEISAGDRESFCFRYLPCENHFREGCCYRCPRGLHAQPVCRRNVDLSRIREGVGAKHNFLREDFQPAFQDVAVLGGEDEQDEFLGVEVNVRQRGEPDRLLVIRITAVNQNESRILVARIPQDILQIHGVAFGKAVIVAAAYRAMDVNLKA